MNTKTTNRIRRHTRIRSKVFGTKEVPRVSVFRSNRHISVQFIDDAGRKTLVSASDADLKGVKKETAVKVAEVAAGLAKKAGISKVVFDRGGYKYHGRVKELAEALRKNGLIF